MYRHSKQFLDILADIKEMENVRIDEVYNAGEIEVILFNYGETNGEVHFREDGFLDFSMYPNDNDLDKKIERIVNKNLLTSPCVSFKEKEEKTGLVLHCKEWYMDDSDAHILRMLSGIKSGEVKGTFDFNILTNKSVEYYEKRLSKIPGIYTGSLTQEEIDFSESCSEFNLYYMVLKKIQELKNEVGDLNYIDEYSEKGDEIRFALEYLCVQTNRFGTNTYPSKDYSAVILDMDYAIWLQSWNAFLSSLPGNFRNFLFAKAENLEDVYPTLYTKNSNIYEEGVKHVYVNPQLFDL